MVYIKTYMFNHFYQQYLVLLTVAPVIVACIVVERNILGYDPDTRLSEVLVETHFVTWFIGDILEHIYIIAMFWPLAALPEGPPGTLLVAPRGRPTESAGGTQHALQAC